MIRARVAMTEAPLVEFYDDTTDTILDQQELEDAETLREEIHYAVATAKLNCGVGECKGTQVGQGVCVHHGGRND